ncbi:helix-turn-helix domain-containing protein [Rhodococcus coprophilus]|uniref:helix-turn-helix domain-containing protein n=1 Tax=Rhodococcus coprophilus TaxID=38310 RepID=UPI0033F6185B
MTIVGANTDIGATTPANHFPGRRRTPGDLYHLNSPESQLNTVHQTGQAPTSLEGREIPGSQTSVDFYTWMRDFHDIGGKGRDDRRTRLDAGVGRVAVAIAAHINNKSGTAWPGLREIARTAQVSRDTVDKAIPKLEAAGWLLVDRRTKPSRYSLRSPLEAARRGGQQTACHQDDAPGWPAHRANVARSPGQNAGEIDSDMARSSGQVRPGEQANMARSPGPNYEELRTELQSSSTPRLDAIRIINESEAADQPRASKDKLARHVAQLLDDGIDPGLIHAGLKRWVARPNVGPGLLPHLVGDAIKDLRSGVSAGKAVVVNRFDNKAAGWGALGAQLKAAVSNAHNTINGEVVPSKAPHAVNLPQKALMPHVR